MKHLLITPVIFALLAIAPSVLAQQSDVITLNDATPAINVVITLPPDTTGAISLNIHSTAVTLTDSQNNTVFQAADGRLHALEFNIAPNTGPHTLTIERLPGMAEALVSIVSLPELTVPGSAELVQTRQLNFNQEVALSLDAANPGDSVTVSIPDQTTGLISATFPGANATAQLVDSSGAVVAASYNGHIDGLNMVLDSGDYHFTVLANNLSNPVVTGVRAIPAEASGYVVLDAPVQDTADAGSGDVCTASVVVNSVNLRSGPGTGYSVIDYGYRGEVFNVGGINPENNWVVIATNSGSAWLSDSVARLSGNCDNLTVFNLPLRDARPAEVIVVTPEPQVIVQAASSGSAFSQPSGSRSHDDDDHDDDHDDD